MLRIDEEHQRDTINKRQVIIAFKTTGNKPEKGDGMTELACVERIGHVETGNNFHAWINPVAHLKGDAFREAMQALRKEYENCPRLKNKTGCQAATIDAMENAPGWTKADAKFILQHGVPEFMMQKISKAPGFSTVEDAFMAYLRQDPNTVIMTHDMGRLRRWMHVNMSEKNWKEFEAKYMDSTKHGLKQKANKFRNVGMFPEKEETAKNWDNGLGLDAIAEAFYVDPSDRTHFSAMQEALMQSDILNERMEMKMDNIERFPNSKSCY